MTAFGYLLGKELRGVFLQPIAWVLMAVFLLVMGYTFATGLALTKTAALSRVVFQAATLLLLLIPLVTMRLLAEEQRHGTLEMLLATPVREPHIVLAKFVASMALVVAMLAPTVVYAVVLAFFGQPEWGPIYSGYVGLLLLASLLSAMGLALSALTSNQVVAATLERFGALDVMINNAGISGVPRTGVVAAVMDDRHTIGGAARAVGRAIFARVFAGPLHAVRDRRHVPFGRRVFYQRHLVRAVLCRARAGARLTWNTPPIGEP